MKTKKAVVGTAKRYELQTKTYPKTAQLSSLKVFIGELLLFGNKQRKEFWELFGILLTQYVQNLTEYTSEPPESTNSNRPEK